MHILQFDLVVDLISINTKHHKNITRMKYFFRLWSQNRNIMSNPNRIYKRKEAGTESWSMLSSAKNVDECLSTFSIFLCT